MKKIILYIIAIPVGLLASMVLPKIFEFVLDVFIPFEVINDFLDNYLMKFLSGWIAVGIPVLIAPSKKKLYGIIMLGLNLSAVIYMYNASDEFNYLFLIGGVLVFIFILFLNSENKLYQIENQDL